MMESIILGIIQGLTEFIPVSSTAHLILIPKFFSWKGSVNTLSYDIALHGGTLVALLVYFRTQWVRLLTHDRHLLLMIFVSTLPAGVIGLLFKGIVSTTFRSTAIIGASLIIIGIVMLLAERNKGERMLSTIKLEDAILIGFAQAVALIPGVSRSGITISAGLFRGIRREDSARYSFLLSMPVITAATLLEGVQIIKTPLNYDLAIFITGLVVSAITGFFTIKFLLWYFRRFSLSNFVYYRFILAGIIFSSYVM